MKKFCPYCNTYTDATYDFQEELININDDEFWFMCKKIFCECGRELFDEGLFEENMNKARNSYETLKKLMD